MINFINQIKNGCKYALAFTILFSATSVVEVRAWSTLSETPDNPNYNYGNWVETGTTLPDTSVPGRVVQQKTQYRYRTKSFKWSTSDESGWTKTGTTQIGTGAWVRTVHNWDACSGGNDDNFSYVTGTSVLISYKTYPLNGWWTPLDLGREHYTIDAPYSHNFCGLDVAHKYSIDRSVSDAKNQFKYAYTDSTQSRSYWTEYQLYQWSGYSAWQDNKVDKSDTVDVQTQVVYRYKDVIDTAPPTHISHALSGAIYQSGSNYWVTSNTSVSIALRGSDITKLGYTYLRLSDSNIDVRGQHSWSNASDSTHLNNFSTNPAVTIDSVKRTYNGDSEQEVTFSVTPKQDNLNLDIQYYYIDTRGNESTSYNSTGMTLRTDDTPPSVSIQTSGKWELSPFSVPITATDTHSGVQTIQYRLSGAHTVSNWTTLPSSGAIAISNEGKTIITVRAQDNVGNWSSEFTKEVYLNLVAPKTSISVNENWTNAGSVTATLYAEVGGKAALTAVHYELTGATSKAPTTFTTGQVITITNEGETTIKTTLINEAGRTVTATKVVKIDRTIPDGGIDIEEEWTNATEVIGTLSLPEQSGAPLTLHRYQLRGATSQDWTTFEDKQTISVTNVGETTVYIEMRDEAGNSKTIEKVVKIDRIAPKLTVLPVITRLSSSPVPIYAYTQDEGGSGFDYLQVNNSDNRLYEAETYFYAPLNGWYDFYSYDKAGNVAYARYEVTNIGVPAVNDSPLHLHYQAVGASPIEWTDNQPPSVQLKFSATGVTVVQSQAHDEAGNLSDIQTTTVQIDKVKPYLTHTLSTSTWTNESIVINATVQDLHSGGDKIKLPTGAIVESETTSYLVNNNGTYTFYGYDKATNESDAYPVEITNIDRTAPTIVITGPTGVDDGTTPIKITVTDNLSGVCQVEYQLSGDTVLTWTPISATSSLYIPNNGTTTLTVRATDCATNPASKSQTFTINGSTPYVSVVADPNVTWSNQPVRVTLEAKDRAGQSLKTAQWSASGVYRRPLGTFETITNRVHQDSVLVQTEGVTTFSATATNNVGKTVNISETVQIDFTAPVLTIQGNGDWTNNTCVNVKVSYYDTLSGIDLTGQKPSYGIYNKSSSQTVLAEDVEFKTGHTVGGETISICEEGEWYLQAHVWDKAGNDTIKESLVAKIDYTAPTVSIVADESWRNDRIPVTFYLTESGSGVEYSRYQLNGAGEWYSFNSGDTVYFDPSQVTTITAVVRDKAQSSASDTKTIHLDNIAPKATITLSESQDWSNSEEVIVTLETYDELSGLEVGKYKISGATDIPWTTYAENLGQDIRTTKTFSATKEGITYIDTWSRDNATNVGEESKVIKLDREMPFISATPSSFSSKDNIIVTFVASDQISGLVTSEYRLSGATQTDWLPIPSTGVLTLENQGHTTIEARAVDKANNESSIDPVTVFIDKEDPMIVSLEVNPMGWTNKGALATVKATDNFEVAKIEYRLSGATTIDDWTSLPLLGAPAPSVTSQSLLITNHGITEIEVRAIDSVGRISRVVTGKASIDLENPYITNFEILIQNLK